MKVVTKELCAALASMTIENGEELDFLLRLLRVVGLKSRLLEVENNRDSVFIVISKNAVVGVGTVRDEIW